MRLRKAQKKLLHLPVPVAAKVALWLVINDLKPAAEFEIQTTRFEPTEKALRVADKNYHQVVSFLRACDLCFEELDLHRQGYKRAKVGHEFRDIPVVIFGKRLYVAKNVATAQKLRKLLKSSSLGAQNHAIIGELFGYPKKVAVEYAKFFSQEPGSKGHPLTWANEFYEMFKNKYWQPYVFYITRKGHELKDAQQGIKWADFTRKTFPELAEEFEKKMKRIKFKPPKRKLI